MSADEEPTSAPTDTPMSEPQSNKRKASIDGELEKEAPTSPKRAKLEQPETEATPPTTDGKPAQEPHPAPKQEDDPTPSKPEQPSATNPSPKAPSPPTQPASPRQSRSPTLSRRPSIPTEPRAAPPGPGPDRSRSRITEQEKKRGQRLFGGLLSTLSQRTPNNPQAKKRAEIEKRQHERAQQQRAEDERRRAEKLAKLTHVRRVEQVALDERMMQTRHKNMLLQARCLATRAEPRVFYLPWKLTEAQEKQLAQQADDTERLIAREVERFERESVRRLKELGVEVDETKPPAEHTEKDRDQPPQKPSATDGKATREEASHDKSNHDNHHDDPDYVTVENEEDTVIY
ncbi:pinin/SDK/memA/ protein conserved region-domain-containing protein [Coniochaeta sp. 2T2.1]|nr:pinin/SDK/memA/ protein conserved region-domain-containing protein [Coniochaeta sp. 2T2.1]